MDCTFSNCEPKQALSPQGASCHVFGKGMKKRSIHLISVSLSSLAQGTCGGFLEGCKLLKLQEDPPKSPEGAFSGPFAHHSYLGGFGVH